VSRSAASSSMTRMVCIVPDTVIVADLFERINLALEALRKLLNDEIRSRNKTNVVETKRFSERLESAIARYHTNAVSTVDAP